MKKKKLKKNQYECGICHGVFNKGWSDEEAWEEFEERHSTIPREETGMVCDPCYKLILKDIANNPWKYPPGDEE